MNNEVLVIGAGIAGIEASLLLANTGIKIHLVEKNAYIGGNVVKYEDVFSNLECATCMIAPIQQEVLQHENISILTLGEVVNISGSCGNFIVKIKKNPRYVSLENCIGCNECFNPCPVSLPNEFEENMSQRKAIYTACAGALPNVPQIDIGACARFKGEDCELCKESCMFEAIEFDQKEEEIEINVAAIILATGFDVLDPGKIKEYNYGADDIYSAFAFERLYASNGPTSGELRMKNGNPPGRIAIISDIGIGDYLHSRALCTMSSLKYIYYVKHKIPEAEIFCLYKELDIPGKNEQRFLNKMIETKAHMIRIKDIEVQAANGSKVINYHTENGKQENIDKLDMIVITTPMVPRGDASEVAEIFNLPRAKDGFFEKSPNDFSPVLTVNKGIFLAGCAEGPKDIQSSVTQAQAAVGRVLRMMNNE